MIYNLINEYFTAAVIGAAVLAVIIWIGVIFFEKKLLILFGAKGQLLPLARNYVLPVKFVVPSFLFTQLMSAFLRNDGNPGLATKAVLIGGIFNVFGDYFFVFTLDMGIMGAGLATAAGAVLSLLIMLTHFLGKKNTLRLVRPTDLLSKLKSIAVTGFATHHFRQFRRKPWKSLKYALCTVSAFSIFWTAVSLAVPNLYVHIFMSPTENILKIAPAIIRSYGISFLLLPLNIFSTYYFQALLKPSASFIVSVSRGTIISGIFIYLLPVLAGGEAIWFAMPLTELIVAVYVVVKMGKYTKQLPTE